MNNEKNFLVDTHCHLDLIVQKQFDIILNAEQISAIQPIVDQAEKADVKRLIMVGAGLPTSTSSVECAAVYPHIFAAIGLHPEEIKDLSWRERFTSLKKLLTHPARDKIVGIGECGLDYFHPHNKQLQADAFRAQIELALEHKLPVVVHSRDAGDETLRIIEEYVPDITATIHCYSYDLAFAEQAVAWNLYLGLGGIITYPKNEYLRLVAKTVPLTSIVLETDAPFLPPQHMRGKPNHPAEIKTIATYLAELRQLSVIEIARQTTLNAYHLFKLP
jgi:TatD DNase family protein